MSQTKAQLVGGVGISTVGDLSVYGGVNATGIVTATSFYGGSATITGNVSIAGTLTYEDVTNVDSVGIVTARSGLQVTGGSVVVGSAVTLSSGGINVVGVITATSSVVGSAVTLSSGGINVVGFVTASQVSSVLTNYSDKINALGNTGASATINLANGNFVTATLTGNCTFTFATGIGTGSQAFTLFLTNDATPSRSITWPVTVKWPGGSTPVRTETANRTDVYSFFTFDNGSNWYGTLSIYNYS
jgi:hypothetical protein